MREPQRTESNGYSIVTLLIIINVAVFAIEQLLNVMFPSIGNFIYDWFALSLINFTDLKVWTIFTYGFLHSPQAANFLFIPIPFAHLIFNMLGLHFIGRHVEKFVGAKHFLILYLGAILAGGLAYIFVHLNNPSTVVGASGGVAAVVALFCLIKPNQQLILFPIPIPIKAIWLFWAGIALSVFGISSELSGRSAVAHSAHLGGILMGIVFFRYIYKSDFAFSTGPSRPSVELPDWLKRKKKAADSISYSVNRSNTPTDRRKVQEEVDRILDKINASGFGSLSDAEKKTLDQAKDILSR